MILLVDDNSGLVTLLLDILSEVGRPVATAGSLQAAVALLQKGNPIDLLITDFNLPDGRGIELSRIARATHPRIKVLLMSGYDIGTPGIDFIMKPFAPQEFLAKVRSLLE